MSTQHQQQQFTATTGTNLTVKIRLGKHNIRRWAWKPEFAEVDVIRSAVEDAFPKMEGKDFALKWADEEGDLITLSSSEDLHTALATTTGGAPQGAPLILHLAIIPPRRRQAEQTNSGDDSTASPNEEAGDAVFAPKWMRFLPDHHRRRTHHHHHPHHPLHHGHGHEHPHGHGHHHGHGRYWCGGRHQHCGPMQAVGMVFHPYQFMGGMGGPPRHVRAHMMRERGSIGCAIDYDPNEAADSSLYINKKEQKEACQERHTLCVNKRACMKQQCMEQRKAAKAERVAAKAERVAARQERKQQAAAQRAENKSKRVAANQSWQAFFQQALSDSNPASGAAGEHTPTIPHKLLRTFQHQLFTYEQQQKEMQPEDSVDEGEDAEDTVERGPSDTAAIAAM